MELLCCNCLKADSEFDITQFLSNLGIIIIGITAIIVSYRQFKKSLEAEKRKEKRQAIRVKLDEFYGPLLQLRKKSNLLYERFSKKFKEEDPNFSTLKYLLDGNEFGGNDLTLLKEIIEIGKKSEELIHKKAGLIDVPNLRLYIIPRATTHYLILKLAFEKALIGDTSEFANLTFPRDFDDLLEERKRELEQELENLN